MTFNPVPSSSSSSSSSSFFGSFYLLAFNVRSLSARMFPKCPLRVLFGNIFRRVSVSRAGGFAHPNRAGQPPSLLPTVITLALQFRFTTSLIFIFHSKILRSMAHPPW